MRRCAPRVGRSAGLSALGLLWAALLTALPAAAHGPEPAAGDLEPRLDALPPELEGMAVQLRSSLGTQLVLQNRSQRPLEVLDGDGVPFLHIAAGGVQANLASPAWYRSFGPEGEPVPRELLDAVARGEPRENRWVAVQREPSWGWFDPRIRSEGSGDSHPRRWEIPLRVAGEPVALRGHFAPRPEPTGTTRARLRSDAQLAPGVRVSLLPGRAGSLFLRSESPQPVTVLGRDGEPFLRLGPAGVEANLRSPTFADVARLRGGAGLALEPRADADPHWQRVSSAPRYAWVDPRSWNHGGASPEAIEKGATTELLRWAIPVRIGSGEEASTVRIEGVTVWEPLPSG